MKVLFLVQKEQRIILDRLYESIEANCDCDTRWLTDDEQANLKRYFKEKVDTSQYDRILFFLRFKKEIKQVGFIRSVPNLVILEHDAWQNYAAGKYHGKFTQYYHHLPWARVLVSGHSIAKKLQQEGVDAVFVPKGYDEQLLCNKGLEREIELGFVGSIRNEAYSLRKQTLEAVAKAENLVITKTKSGEEYVNTLNRIKFFVSADVGFGEYMIKNFEAMACGCVLIAYDQGVDENQALGFVDMENIVLYRNLQDIQEKLKELRANPEKAEQIAKAGQQLVESRYSYKQLGKTTVAAMTSPLRERPKDTFWEKLYYGLKG
ncbi:glycosyltransferase [Entomomonas sp. E2T0]|uniref:glycosyltransferase n=1 Tax=Entomomonas sp. E2T0 TaxID=2930213 RepID=UPI0022282CD4|nr:glycosyltransferase [Entomomonas sp. E2T0]UYZ84386.1 glycosyltransferase [Entomomonas sp. E2T0]